MQMFNASKMNLDGGEIHKRKILGVAILGNMASLAVMPHNGTIKHFTSSVSALSRYRNSDFICHILDSVLPNIGNWGDDEEDYDTALISKNQHLRILVAVNGRYKDVLVKDEVPDVRIAVLLYLQSRVSMRRIRLDGNILDFSDIEGFEDTSYLDPLVDDPDYYVRFHLAKLGMDRHVKKLLHSNDVTDVKKVLDTMFGYEIERVISYGNNYMDVLIASNNGRLTTSQLEVIANERSEYIQLGLVRRGFVSHTLKSSQFESVRYAWENSPLEHVKNFV